MVSSLEEEAEQYEVNAEIIRSSKAEQKVINARSAAGKSINDVSTLSDYMTLRESVLKDVTDEKERDAILAELANQEGTKEFETAALAMTN
jgi:hypothetical protein